MQDLSSSDRSLKMRALKTVKNQIIGRPSKKLAYMQAGALPRVLEILASRDSEADSEMLVQSLGTVGSFAYGSSGKGLAGILRSGGLPHIVHALASPDPRVGGGWGPLPLGMGV